MQKTPSFCENHVYLYSEIVEYMHISCLQNIKQDLLKNKAVLYSFHLQLIPVCSWLGQVFYNCSKIVVSTTSLQKISKICIQMELLQDFYETTLEALKDAKNDRLWFKTNTKVSMIPQFYQ